LLRSMEQRHVTVRSVRQNYLVVKDHLVLYHTGLRNATGEAEKRKRL